MSDNLIHCALFLAGFLLCYLFDYLNTKKDVKKVMRPTLDYLEEAFNKCIEDNTITEEQAVKLVKVWKSIINKKGFNDEVFKNGN